MSNTPKIVEVKARATALGLSYSPNIGVETLEKRIKAHLAEQNEAPADHDYHEQKIKEATKLIRIIATPTDQRKLDGERQGEYVMAGNSVIGTFKKFIPYGQPVHIEQVLLNVLQEKKYQQRYGKGNQLSREVKEFSIEILPDLTPAEVAELKKMQAIRKESANL